MFHPLALNHIVSDKLSGLKHRVRYPLTFKDKNIHD